MNKQKILPLAILAAVILLLGAALALLGGVEEDTGETPAIPLCAFAADEAERLHYAESGLDVTLLKGKEGNWMLESDPALPIDTGAVTSLAEKLVALTAERRLEGSDLDELPPRGELPLMELCVEAGEQSMALWVDSFNEVAGVYYVYDAAGTVYTVASADLTGLLKTPRQLYAAQRLTEKSADDVTALTVNGERFTRADGAWTLESDPEFALDQDAVERMANTLCELTTEWTVTNPDGDYGLENPDVTATLHFADGTALTAAFGKPTPDDETLCYLSADGMVYEVSAIHKGYFTLSKSALAAPSTAETAASTADIIAEAPVGGIDDFID